MPYAIRLPDGTLVENIPDELPPEQAKQRIISAGLLKAPAAPQAPQSTITGELLRGGKQLVSSVRTGLESLLSPEEAAIAGVERGQKIAEEAGEGPSLAAVRKAYEERGLLPAAGEVVSQIPRALAGQGAQIAAMAGGARLGATAGAAVAPFLGPAAPLGPLVGGALGAGATLLPQFMGANVQRQAQEQMERGEPVAIDRTAAYGSAAGQAAIESAGTAFVFGKRLVKGVLGIADDAALASAKAQQELAKAASRSVAAAAGRGAVRGTAEIPVEIAQAVLERAQAGLDLTSPEALTEYGENAYLAGLVGPTIGSVTSVMDRNKARAPMEGQLPGETLEQSITRLQREILAETQQPPPEQTAVKTNLANLLAQPNGYGLLEQRKQTLMQQEQTPEIQQQLKEIADLQGRYNAEKYERQLNKMPSMEAALVDQSGNVLYQQLEELKQQFLSPAYLESLPYGERPTEQQIMQNVAEIEQQQQKVARDYAAQVIQAANQPPVSQGAIDVGTPVTPPSGEGAPVAIEPSAGAAPAGVGVTQPSGVVPSVEDAGLAPRGEEGKPAAIEDTRKAQLLNSIGFLNQQNLEANQATITGVSPEGMLQINGDFQKAPRQAQALLNTLREAQQLGATPQEISDAALSRIKPPTTDVAVETAPVAPPPQQKQAPRSGLPDTEVGGAPAEPATTVAPGAGPAITERDEYEQAVVDANKAARKVARKSPSLWTRLRGQLDMSDVNDISSDRKFRILGTSGLGQKRGKSLSTFVADGMVDEFLPFNMRHDVATFDEYNSTEYIKDRLREGNYLTYEAQMELEQISMTVAQLEENIDALLQEKEVNELIQEAVDEQVGAAEEAAPIEPRGEAATAGAVSGEEAAVKPKKSLAAVPPTAWGELERRAKATREAPPKEAAPEEKPTQQLTPETQKKIKQLQGLLKTLMNRFGLKDVGLNLVNDLEANGEYANKLIKLALDAVSPVRDLRHESLHALKELGFFTPQQWAVLEKKAKDTWIDQFLKQRNVNGFALQEGQQSRYDAYVEMFTADQMSPDAMQEALIEEAISDAFGEFDVNKAPVGLMQAILKRMKTFFAVIKEALGQARIESAEDIFERVEKGELQPKNAWKATPQEVQKAEDYEEKNGIAPYISEGRLDLPTKLSIKTNVDKYGVAPVLDIPLNKDGTVTVYYHTTKPRALQYNGSKVIPAEGRNRIYLTNESSGAKVLSNKGNFDQEMDGSAVLLNIHPSLLQIDQTYPDGRKDFFVPLAQGDFFNRKMQASAIQASRRKPITEVFSYADHEDRITKALNDYRNLDAKGKRDRLKKARAVLKQEHNVGTLMTENGKLEKTRIGEYGLTYEGKPIDSMGLGLASAQQISEKLSTCPNSAICEGLCLGETSGGNFLYGGAAQDDILEIEKSAFRAGPRMMQYLKTEALIIHPEEFAIVLQSEIDSLRRWDNSPTYRKRDPVTNKVMNLEKEVYKSAVRLNVTSDFKPSMWTALIEGNPDVMFYDYTKIIGNRSIADNHHLTYSSTGFGQNIDGEPVFFKTEKGKYNHNWAQVRNLLNSGKNVAMAFSSKSQLPDTLVDEETGVVYNVLDGDNYDARFLDEESPLKKGLGRGVIVGLRNKAATLKEKTATKATDGFFVDYDPKRDGDSVTVPDQTEFGAPPYQAPAGKGIPIAKASLRAGYDYDAALKLKWKRMDEFDKDKNSLMQRINKDALDGNEAAIILRLINATGFRVGNPKGESKGMPTFGATSLRPEHVLIDGDTITFDFRGKAGIQQQHVLKDADIAADLASRLDGRETLFTKSDKAVRTYLSELRGAKGYKIHDFRTWAATDAALQAMSEIPTPVNKQQFKEAEKVVIEAAARKIGDLATTARKSYVHPKIFEAWRAAAGLPAGDDVQAFTGAVEESEDDLSRSEGEQRADEGVPAKEPGVKRSLRAPESPLFVTDRFTAKDRGEYGIDLRNPITLKNGVRLDGFSDRAQTTFTGYDKNGERITMRRTDVNPDDIVFSKDSNKTAEAVKKALEQTAPKASLRAPQTEAFKRWFGDSKVVDENGEPLVVYHGTGADIAVFDPSKQDPRDSGFWFANAPLYANQYAAGKKGGNVMPVYLSLKNPKIYYDRTTPITPKLIETLKEQGYDGIIRDFAAGPDAWRYAKGQREYAVFQPEQIKSAIGNIGAYGQRPVTAEEARRFGMTAEEANAAQKQGDIRFSLRDKLGMYSELENKIAQGSNKAPAASWKAYVNGLTQKGVKPEEIEWSGVRDWLDLQKGTVTKDDLLNYLKQGGVKVEETVLGAPVVSYEEAEDAGSRFWPAAEKAGLDTNRLERQLIDGSFDVNELPENMRDDGAIIFASYSESDAATKYGQYTLPGGENYREVLLTLPTQAQPMSGRVVKDGKNEKYPWAIFVNGEEVNRVSDESVARDVLEEELTRARKKARRGDEQTYRSSHWDQPNVLAHIRLNDRTDADGKKVLFVEEIQSDWGQEGKKKGFKYTEQQRGEIEKRLTDLELQKNRVRKEGFRVPRDGDRIEDTDPNFLKYQDLQRQYDAVEKQREDQNRPALAPFVTKTEGWLNLALKRIMVMAAEGGYDKVAFITGDQSHHRFPEKQDGSSTKGSFSAFYGEFNGKVVNDEGQQVFDKQGKATVPIVKSALNKLLPKIGGKQVEDVNFRAPRLGQPRRTFPQPGFDVTPDMKQKVETTGLPRFSIRDKKSVRNNLSPATRAEVDRVTTARYEPGFVERITKAIAPEAFSKLRAQALNRYNQLSVYDKLKAKQMGGVELLADQSAEAAALMSDLGAGVTAQAMGVHDRVGGIPVYRKGYTTVSNEGGTVKGIIAIFAPLAKYGDPEVYRDFQFWAGSKRGSRFLADGKEQLYTPANMKQAQEILKVYPEFENIFKEWTKYNEGLVKYMVDTGVISAENGKKFVEHSDYIPFYRQIDGETTVGPNIFQSIAGVKAPKKIKHGEEPLADFLETIVRNTQASIQAGLKNVAAQRAVKMAEDIGQAARLPNVQAGVNIVTVLENGKKVSYDCNDPLFINAVKSLNLPDLPFIGLLAGPANLLRNLVTKDPGFMLANMMRDSMSAMVTSGVNMTPIVSTIKNFGDAIAGKSPEYDALLKAGVLGGYDYSAGVEASAQQLAKELRKEAKVSTAAEKAMRPATWLWEALEKGTQASDAATRIEVYKKTLEATGNEAEALFRALEVMNFNRKGSSAVIRIATAAIPFLNARMQGLDVLYRAAISPSLDVNATERAKQIQKTFFVRGMTIAALSCMYWMMTHDEDEYKKQEQETRDNYWLFPSLGIKIPIPFEVGIIFKVIPERIMAYTFGDDTGKDFMKSMKRNFENTLPITPMGMIPQLAKPYAEVTMNYSLFTGRPIIGQGMETVAPKYQSLPMTATFLKDLGEQLNISPIKMEYLIRGYTGTIGSYMVDAIDSIYNMNVDAPRASKRFEQMPVLKRFALDPEARGTVTAYYDLKNAVDTVVRTSNYLERTQNYEAYAKYLEDNMEILVAKDYVLDMYKTLSDFNEYKQMIRGSEMSADEKRDALLQITEVENQLTANIQTFRKMAKQ